MFRACPGLYWHYKEIIRALEQGDEQWIPSHSQPDFAQFLAVVPPCEVWRWVCFSSLTFLAPPAGLCFGESKEGARAPSPAPHSHTAASDMKSITFPLPLLDFHCRGAAQTPLRAECRGHRSLALLSPVPTLPAQEGYG